MKNNNIYSITVTYNPRISTLKGQLDSLERQVSSMIVVDNGSENIEEISNLMECFDKTKLIKMGENHGIAVAQNRGIKYAITKKPTHILFLDHDSIVGEKFVEGLIETEGKLLNHSLPYSAIGPVYFDPRTNLNYPIKVAVKTPFLNGIKISEKIIEEDQHLKAAFLISSGSLINIDVLMKVGLMREKLFIDNVDVDWCYRAINMGLPVYATSRSKMSHAVGDERGSFLGRSVAIHSNIRMYYSFRNNLFLLKQSYIPFGRKVRVILFLLARFFIGYTHTGDKKEYFRVLKKSCLDFFKGNYGKMEL